MFYVPIKCNKTLNMSTLLTLTYSLMAFFTSLHDISPIHAQSSIDLDIKVFLEGPYNAQAGKMSTKLYELGYLPGMKPKAFFAEAVPFFDPYGEFYDQELKTSSGDVSSYTDQSVDWIFVSIREATTGTVVANRTVLLNADGTLSAGSIPVEKLNTSAKYIVVLAHRNHLPVQSTPIKLSKGKLAFDFTNSDILGLKLKHKVMLMIAGNIDQTKSKSTRVINMEDVNTWRTANGKNSSYIREDIDMNGDVSVHDQSIILENLDLSTSVKINE